MEPEKLNKQLKKLPDELIFLIQQYIHKPQPKEILNDIDKLIPQPSAIKAINMFMQFHMLAKKKLTQNMLDKNDKVKHTMMMDSYQTAIEWLGKDLLSNLNINKKYNELSISFHETLKNKKILKNQINVDMFFHYMETHGSYKSKIVALWCFMTEKEIKMYLNMVKTKLSNAKLRVNNIQV